MRRANGRSTAFSRRCAVSFRPTLLPPTIVAVHEIAPRAENHIRCLRGKRLGWSGPRSLSALVSPSWSGIEHLAFWDPSSQQMGFAMDIRRLLSALAVCAIAGSVQARAQGSTVTYKSLSTEIALELAQATLADCRQRGYQVAVAV